MLRESSRATRPSMASLSYEAGERCVQVNRRETFSQIVPAFECRSRVEEPGPERDAPLVPVEPGPGGPRSVLCAVSAEKSRSQFPERLAMRRGPPAGARDVEFDHAVVAQAGE